MVLSKNDSNIICSSIKNESFLKIWRVWHILKVCHALWYLKIEMGIAGSIFELHPPNFQKMCIFWRFTNDISTIFCYLLWFQFWKKCQSLPVHPRVVPGLTKDTGFHKKQILHEDGFSKKKIDESSVLSEMHTTLRFQINVRVQINVRGGKFEKNNKHNGWEE